VGNDVDRDPNYGPDDPQNANCNSRDTVDGMTDQRDRDPAGRARNARPRDAAGRPLPRGASGVARVPDDLVLGPQASVDEAQRLLDEGMPFHAHEVLEAAWKAAEPAQRELWRGLAQLAVGLTHLQRGNARGAVALLRRGAERVVRWQVGWIGPLPADLALDDLVRHAERLADRVERDGPTVTSATDLRPCLRRPRP
jgi:uncharacterized protein